MFVQQEWVSMVPVPRGEKKLATMVQFRAVVSITAPWYRESSLAFDCAEGGANVCASADVFGKELWKESRTRRNCEAT
jgi:hypothetical protein